MSLSRRRFIARSTALGACASPLLAQGTPSEFDLLRTTITGSPDNITAALNAIRKHGRPDLASGLIVAMRFSQLPSNHFAETLTAITGTDAGVSWFDWMLWQEANPQIAPHQQSLIALKREVYLQIDPNFDVFLKPHHLRRNRMKIRLEEITWGVVYKDGTPSLDNPRVIAASDASYMRKGDLVVGVSINGDTRAYPLGIMGWNEVIGGVPVAVAYRTLCGSGILFGTKVRGHSKPVISGSPGFLYRSNKLMFDRASHWF